MRALSGLALIIAFVAGLAAIVFNSVRCLQVMAAAILLAVGFACAADLSA